MAVNERDQELHGSMVDNDGHSTVGNFYYRWMARSEYDNLPTMLEPIEAINCDKDKMMEEDLESERMDVCEQIENNLLSQQGGVNKISQDIQGNHDLQECTADYDSEQESHDPVEDDEVSSSLYNRWMTQSEDNNYPTMLEAINRDKDNEDEPMEVDKQMEDNLPPQQGGVSSDDDGDDLSKPTFETKSATKIPSSSLKSPALNIARSYDNYIDVLDDWIDIDDDEDPDYLAAIEASLKDQNSQNNETLASSTSKEEVKDILKKFISKNIVEDGDNTLNILVSRKAILQSTLRAIERKSFSFEMPMFVKFAGEDGIDAGGPKREFFRLLMQNIKGIGIFDGSGWFVHDLTLLKQRKYELAGKLITWSILHGGPGPKCLAMEAFSIVQDKPIDLEKVIEILLDVKLKEILKSLKEAKEAEFPNVIEKHGDDIAEYGYSAIYTSKSSDKMKIVDCLLKQSFLFSVHAEVEQFRKGMNMVGGFGDIVFENYAVFHTVLGNNQDELTSNIIKANYRVNFSEAGSNNKEKELETMYCFELFLQDLEEGEVDDDLHLSDLMIFMTGADCVPPLGFDNPISIEFYDHSDREKRLPWSSTCSLSLNLPRGITDPLTMRVMMCRCLKEGQGFGKC